MNYDYEEIKQAFDAYQKCHLTDAQLKILLDSVNALVDTMHALDGSGYAMFGYYQLADSLRHMTEFRKAAAPFAGILRSDGSEV